MSDLSCVLTKALLCVCACWVWFAPPADAKVVHRERSLYSTILVDQRGSLFCLQFSVRRDQRNQSCIDKRHPREMVLAYTRMMMTGLLVQPAPQSILMIGMGGGTIPTVLAELYPEAKIDVVEIDPAVIKVARAYFNFVETPKMRVLAQDGRVFVKRAALNGERYDLIFLDAFNGDYIPEHLMAQEFLQEVRSLMSPGAVVVANTFAISRLYHHESTTYHSVFGDFLNLKSNNSANRIILAVNGPLPDNATLRQTAMDLQPRIRVYGLSLRKHVARMGRRPDWDTGARILTDQYAPANLLRDR